MMGYWHQKAWLACLLEDLHGGSRKSVGISITCMCAARRSWACGGRTCTWRQASDRPHRDMCGAAGLQAFHHMPQVAFLPTGFLLPLYIGWKLGSDQVESVLHWVENRLSSRSAWVGRLCAGIFGLLYYKNERIAWSAVPPHCGATEVCKQCTSGARGALLPQS